MSKLSEYASKALMFFQSRQSIYRRCFGTREGRYVLQDLYKFCGVDRQVLDVNATNDVIYGEGMRRVALHIHKALNESADDMLGRAEKYNDVPTEDQETGIQTHAQDQEHLH